MHQAPLCPRREIELLTRSAAAAVPIGAFIFATRINPGAHGSDDARHKQFVLARASSRGLVKCCAYGRVRGPSIESCAEFSRNASTATTRRLTGAAEMPSLVKIALTCFSTVDSERNRARSMPALVVP